MGNKKIIFIAIIASTCFFIGDWLMSLYGFDPPYYVFYSGVVLKTISEVIFLVAIFILVVKFISRKGAATNRLGK